MSDQQLASPLPDKITTKILTLIPTKPLHRFKLVSKRWNSLLSDPTFLSLYTSLHPPTWTILDRVVHVSTRPFNPPGSAKFQLKSPPNRVSRLTVTTELSPPIYGTLFPAIVASSNGLLLFTSPPIKISDDDQVSKEITLSVINPITRDLVRLPDPDCGPVEDRGIIGLTTRVDPVSGLLDRFMVVEYLAIRGLKKAVLNYYDSYTGRWDKKEGTYPVDDKDHLWQSNGCFEFQKRLHWIDLWVGLICWDCDDYFRSGKKAKCRHIPLPKDCYAKGGEVGDTRCFGVAEGWIQFVEVVKSKRECVFNVWRLKGYESGEWCLVHSAPCWVEEKVPKPWLFNPFEAEIVFFEVEKKVYFVDVKSKKVEKCFDYSDCAHYVFLAAFVIPSWPSPVPQMDAASAKERGNEYFKEKNFEEAIKCYSRCIICSPTAAMHSNRAAAYLNLKRYLEAESDCTNALKLDTNCLKACWRRVLARKELGMLKEAMKDAEHALKLDPGQHEMMKLHADLKSSIEKRQVLRKKGKIMLLPSYKD